jgi:hypothetical protein
MDHSTPMLAGADVVALFQRRPFEGFDQLVGMRRGAHGVGHHVARRDGHAGDRPAMVVLAQFDGQQAEGAQRRCSASRALVSTSSRIFDVLSRVISMT